MSHFASTRLFRSDDGHTVTRGELQSIWHKRYHIPCPYLDTQPSLLFYERRKHAQQEKQAKKEFYASLLAGGADTQTIAESGEKLDAAQSHDQNNQLGSDLQQESDAAEALVRSRLLEAIECVDKQPRRRPKPLLPYRQAKPPALKPNTEYPMKDDGDYSTLPPADTKRGVELGQRNDTRSDIMKARAQSADYDKIKQPQQASLGVPLARAVRTINAFKASTRPESKPERLPEKLSEKAGASPLTMKAAKTVITAFTPASREGADALKLTVQERSSEKPPEKAKASALTMKVTKTAITAFKPTTKDMPTTGKPKDDTISPIPGLYIESNARPETSSAASLLPSKQAISETTRKTSTGSTAREHRPVGREGSDKGLRKSMTGHEQRKQSAQRASLNKGPARPTTASHTSVPRSATHEFLKAKSAAGLPAELEVPGSLMTCTSSTCGQSSVLSAESATNDSILPAAQSLEEGERSQSGEETQGQQTVDSPDIVSELHRPSESQEQPLDPPAVASNSRDSLHMSALPTTSTVDRRADVVIRKEYMDEARTPQPHPATESVRKGRAEPPPRPPAVIKGNVQTSIPGEESFDENVADELNGKKHVDHSQAPEPDRAVQITRKSLAESCPNTYAAAQEYVRAISSSEPAEGTTDTTTADGLIRKESRLERAQRKDSASYSEYLQEPLLLQREASVAEEQTPDKALSAEAARSGSEANGVTVEKVQSKSPITVYDNPERPEDLYDLDYDDDFEEAPSQGAVNQTPRSLHDELDVHAERTASAQPAQGPSTQRNIPEPSHMPELPDRGPPAADAEIAMEREHLQTHPDGQHASPEPRGESETTNPMEDDMSYEFNTAPEDEETRLPSPEPIETQN